MGSLNRSRAILDAPILIVDDDPSAVDALRRILQRGGYSRAHGTTDPRSVPELLTRHRPSLVVLDLHMPGMDGFEVLKGIWMHCPPSAAPAVLVITGSDARSDRLSALESGAGDFLLKPYDPYEVLLRVGNLLEIHSKRRLISSFLNSTPAAMIARDADGHCTYVNRSALDLLGYEDAESVIGRDVHALIHHSHPDGRPFDRSDCRTCCVSPDGGPLNRVEDAYWRADGTMLPVECWTYPLADERQSGAALLTFVDLTERLESKRHLRLASTVFDSVNRALVITDAEANIISVNPAYTELTGWTKDEVVGKNPKFRQSGRHGPGFYRDLWRSLLEDGHWEGEIWNLRKDGACYLEELNITTVRDASGEVTNYVATARDLTEARRRSDELERAKREAESANQAKSRFVANMSHEIRTPLTAILGFAETLADVSRSEADREQAVATIIRNARYLQELVNDILDFSKIEAGRLEVERVDTSLVQLLHSIAALGAAQAKAKGLEFRVEVDSPWPRTLTTDPTRAKQILMNLLSNAIKFTERGQVSLRVSLDAAHERLLCAVQDTGIGIAENRLAEIFESFVQADASTTRSHGGSGLGLTISQALARRLGGELSVSSTPGRGSLFTASFATGPMPKSRLEDTPPDLSEALQVPVEVPNALPRLRGTVLVAEDYADNRELIRYYIACTGARVLLAENGQQAVDLAQQESVDLVLMDMQMPVMNGHDATQLLRLTGFDGPILALTANATESDLEAALAAGCDGFLAKPVQQGPFYNALASHLPAGSPQPPAAQSEPLGVWDSLGELRASFFEGLPGQLDALREASGQKDYKQVATLAHQLKGVAGSFGMPDATRVAGALEEQARAGDETSVSALLHELERRCQAHLN